MAGYKGWNLVSATECIWEAPQGYDGKFVMLSSSKACEMSHEVLRDYHGLEDFFLRVVAIPAEQSAHRLPAPQQSIPDAAEQIASITTDLQRLLYLDGNLRRIEIMDEESSDSRSESPILLANGSRIFHIQGLDSTGQTEISYGESDPSDGDYDPGSESSYSSTDTYDFDTGESYHLSVVAPEGSDSSYD